MSKSRTVLAGGLAIAAVAVAGCGGATTGGSKKATSTSSPSGGSGVAGGTINGAGSTLGQPNYEQWGSTTADKYGITLNYQGVGSGAGVAQFIQRTTDFGATDPPMSNADIAAAEKNGSKVLHVPTVFGGITVSYKLSGVKSGLRLDGPTIADIFMGKVTKWNDAEIAKLNAGRQLPAEDISVCHRSDESGTTQGFTEFLSQTSPEWKQQIGSDKTVKWPVGAGAQGNQGVAACVERTDGSIGYVEQAYALQNHFTYANVKNSSGNFVAPTLDSVSAAGDGLRVPSDLRFTVINAPNPKAYPIASQTFIVVYEDMCKVGKSKAVAENVQKFLLYGLNPQGGQQETRQLAYAPLPASLDHKAIAQVNKMQCNGAPLSSGQGAS